MFYKSTWKNSIVNHFSDFKDNYKKQLENNPSVLGGSYFDLKGVFEDPDVCSFFKKLLEKFIEHKNKKNNNLAIDLNYSDKKKSGSLDNDFNTKINIDYEINFKRINIRDYSH